MAKKDPQINVQLRACRELNFKFVHIKPVIFFTRKNASNQIFVDFEHVPPERVHVY